MAFSASGVYALTMFNLIGGTASHIIKLGAGADALLVALYNNSSAPDKTTSTQTDLYYNSTTQWPAADEVWQAGQWAQGGVSLGSPVLSQATNVVKFTGANTASGAAATLAGVYGCLVYDNTLANKDGICFNYFGGTNTVTGGTFTVVWNASGIATWTS